MKKITIFCAFICIISSACVQQGQQFVKDYTQGPKTQVNQKVQEVEQIRQQAIKAQQTEFNQQENKY